MDNDWKGWNVNYDMILIKRHSQFLLDKENDKPDAKLRYRTRWNGCTVAFSVGYRVSIDKWSFETQRCKSGTSHGKDKTSASDINKAIQNMEDEIDNIFHEFESSDKVPSADELRSAYNVSIGKDPGTNVQNTISVVIDKFTEKAGKENAWADSTFKKITTIKMHLTNCFGDIPVNDITEDSLNRFMLHLQKTGMRNTTIAKDIKITKWFLRWAKRNKYYSGDSFDTFSPKMKGTNGKIKEVIYLTWDELTNLYSLEIKSNTLSYVRDVFCFCCFTGLRFSDVAKLKKVDVYDSHISVVTEKTDDAIKIELNKYSKSLLDKYKDIPLQNGLALPVISNQKTNVYLKDVAKLAGLTEPIRIVYFKGNRRIEDVYQKHELITTHCGRRTFIVNALYLGIPSEVIMKWTGHSDFDSMKPYVAIVDKLKEQEMNKFNRD